VLPDDVGYSGTARRVLEASVELFAQRGYHGTSMRDIGRAVGLKAASLYEHFPSKAEILATIGRIAFATFRDRFQAVVEGSPADPAVQARALVEAAVHGIWQYRELSMVASSELRLLPRELAQPLDWSRAETSMQFGAVIGRGIQEGAFADRNVAVVVTSILSMCLRVPYWFTPTAEYTLDDLARDYGDLALALLTAPAGGSG
jgi:AcrR family transcriptional regulator